MPVMARSSNSGTNGVDGERHLAREKLLMSAPRKLRELLKSPGLVMAGGAHDGFQAGLWKARASPYASSPALGCPWSAVTLMSG